MSVGQILAAKTKPTISFEFYPPRTPKASSNLDKAIAKLASLAPDFVSVTFGAGGSSIDGSRELVFKLKNEFKLSVLAYVACIGLGPAELSSVLDAYSEMGVDSILAVRGDIPPDQPDFKCHSQGCVHASDFVDFIRSRFDFCLGVAGYPEGHQEAESRTQDLAYLKLKVDRGADFIISQYFYDNRHFFDFYRKCRALGITVPILAGVMPIFNVNTMEHMAALCGASIPDQLRREFEKLPDGDKDAVLEYGVAYALRQSRELIAAGVAGLHFYTLDKSKATLRIVKALQAEGLV